MIIMSRSKAPWMNHESNVDWKLMLEKGTPHVLMLPMKRIATLGSSHMFAFGIIWNLDWGQKHCHLSEQESWWLGARGVVIILPVFVL